MINIICGPNTGDCLYTINSKCVIYDGPSTTNIGYTPNMKLTDLLLLIDSKFAGISSGTFMADSQSNDIQGTGISSNPYTVNTKVSLAANNGLVILPDGLYSTSGGDLQVTTNLGNFTTNAVYIIGNNSTQDDGPGLSFHWNSTTGDSTIESTNAAQASSILNLDVSQLVVNNPIVGITEAPGTNNTRMASTAFVTSAIAAIPAPVTFYTGDGTINTSRFVNMNGNQLSFGGASDFRVQGMSFATFSINDTNFLITDGVNGTILAQGGNLISSSTGNVIIHAASNDLPNKSIECRVATVVPLTLTDHTTTGISGTFAGRVVGANAVNPNEFVTLSQVGTGNNIYNSDGIISGPRTVDINSSSLSFTNAGTFAVGATTNTSFSLTSLGIDIVDSQSSIVLDNLHLTLSATNDIILSAAGVIDVVGTTGINLNSTIISLAEFPTSDPFAFLTTDSSGNLQFGSMNALDLEQVTTNGNITTNSIEIGGLTVSGGGSVNIGVPTTFTNVVVGVPAVSPNEFVVLSQIQGATIDSTPLASTAITQAFMNTSYGSLVIGSKVIFTNLTDDATKTLVVNKLTATTWSANADTKLT